MKIFCIGFHKTGTVSLEKALQNLGVITRHGYVKHSDLIKKAMQMQLPPLALLDESIGFTDPDADYAYLDLYAVRDYFAWLDENYPDSKFILTTREEESWVGSVYRQKKNRPVSPYFHHYYYQHEKQWRHHKRHHEAAVLEYFVNRPEDLLVMNIPAGDGYGLLCDFLGVDMPGPSNDFPHENKSPQKA